VYFKDFWTLLTEFFRGNYINQLYPKRTPAILNLRGEGTLPEGKKENYFIRILIVLFILFLAFLVCTSFFNSQQPFVINSGVITVLLLITVLILSEAFDNLSLGKILYLRREVKNKQEEIIEAKKENSELRNRIIQLASMVTQTQHQNTTNNNMLFTPEVLQQMFGVVKADKDNEDELEEINGQPGTEDGEKQAVADNKNSTNENGKEERKTILSQPGAWRYFEELAISKYLKKHNIPETDVVREVQFTPALSGLDPIMERRVIFDAYWKTPSKEYFIEVRQNRFAGPSIYNHINHIYVLLAKILFYRQAKNIQAELILLLIDLPDSENNSSNLKYSTERFLEAFQPAIASGLLRIETISFSKEEVENVLNQEDNQKQIIFR